MLGTRSLLLSTHRRDKGKRLISPHHPPCQNFLLLCKSIGLSLQLLLLGALLLHLLLSLLIPLLYEEAKIVDGLAGLLMVWPVSLLDLLAN